MCILNSSLTVSAQSMMGEKIIGIDLGTTQSVVSIYENGKVTIIPNDQGNRITPSIVSFHDGDRLIGDAAYNVMGQNPRNTIFDAKRFIGRNFDDASVQKDIKLLPFDVINKNNKPYFKIFYKDSIHEFSAEEVSAMILTKMKQTAEAYLGEKISKAVITVPAYFDDSQRQSTVDAGKIAGLNVVRILNEPTSAAIAYGIDKRSDEEKNRELNVIVYDLGGGTFDVSLLTLEEGIFEVQANGGDTHLGGEDFDENVLKFMIKQFKKKTGLDITTNNKALSKLRKECEKGKRALSSTKQVKIEIENIMNGEDFSELLTRARFEDLNMKLFKKTIKPLNQLLSDSKLKKNEIDEIILVGGSTRIPKIQELVRDYFNGKELNRGINPDESVSYGAAIQAAIIGGFYDSDNDGIVIINSTPLSLGIETVGGLMTKIIPRNTVYPSQKTQMFSTHQDNQDTVLIQIFQGERAMTADNRFLGKFSLTNIPKQPRGVPQIDVTFEIDANGLLQVEASEKSIGTKEKIIIRRDDQNNLSDEEIERMIIEQEKFAEEDELIIKTVNAKNKLEADAFALKNKISDLNDKNEINEGDYDTLNELCNDMIEWIEDNESSAEYDDYFEKQQEFDQIVQQIFNQHQGGTNDQNYYDHEDL